MRELIEINGEHIAALSDTDLRTLIGLLCEADFQLAGISTSGVTWGGHQNAGDGGLDVVIRSDSIPESSFIIHKITGFQVKKPDMPPSAIKKEMRPDGKLRDSIQGLIRSAGAYIIISSKSSVADSSLKNRVEAMKASIEQEDINKSLYLDFYDQNRIATWVRMHPSLIIWVRKKIGLPIHGWKPYENWSNPASSLDEEYLIDEKLKLFSGVKSNHGYNTIDAINLLRKELISNGKSIRLTGLSGVGKTRFVQALFDERIGENPLNKHNVLYTDIADSPFPDPKSLSEQLVAENKSALLIIDNCQPDLHSQLVRNCIENSRLLSLITIEYDIRDDLPEGTDVYRLDSSTDDLIEGVIKQKFPKISYLNLKKIADFSEGNFRVAIALANGLRQGESVSNFNNNELFNRLFHQRHSIDSSLLRTAEIASLVYSFNCEDINDTFSELKFLASLANLDVNLFYRNISELKNRGLVQSRNKWRAILPHAIANRLAKSALQSFPPGVIEDKFLIFGTERLIRSFSRRLGFLHDSDCAQKIAEKWLGEQGYLGACLGNLSSFGLDLFVNIAPVSLDATITAIERVIRNNATALPDSSFFVKVVAHIAYDQVFFDRCIDVLLAYAMKEDVDSNKNNSSVITLASLFYIDYSGTYASFVQKRKWIQKLCDSPSEKERFVGVILLGSSLNIPRSRHFPFDDFGARSRDYGYRPKNEVEVVEWYGYFFDYAVILIFNNHLLKIKIKKHLALFLFHNWDWAKGWKFMRESSLRLHNESEFIEGWISTRRAIKYKNRNASKKQAIRLRKLERKLRPKDSNLEHQIRCVVLASHDYEDVAGAYDNDGIYEKIDKQAFGLGRELSLNIKVLDRLLPELVVGNKSYSQSFGKGLGAIWGVLDRHDLWAKIYHQISLASLPIDISFVQGLLSSYMRSDGALCNIILNKLMIDQYLGIFFPYFQCAVGIDEIGYQRLLQHLDTHSLLLESYTLFGYEIRNKYLLNSEEKTIRVLEKILNKNGGVEVSLRILTTLFFKDRNNSEAVYSPLILRFASHVIERFFISGESACDYNLTSVLKEVLKSKNIFEEDFYIAIFKGIKNQRYRFYSDMPDFFNLLAKNNHLLFLEVFCSSSSLDEFRIATIFFGLVYEDDARLSNPLSGLEAQTILEWCKQNPNDHFPAIAPVAPLHVYDKTDGTRKWLPLFFDLVKDSPNLVEMLKNIDRGYSSCAYRILQSKELRAYLGLYEGLFSHESAELVTWAKVKHSKTIDNIKEREVFERERQKENDERFE